MPSTIDAIAMPLVPWVAGPAAYGIGGTTYAPGGGAAYGAALTGGAAYGSALTGCGAYGFGVGGAAYGSGCWLNGSGLAGGGYVMKGS
ncbi:hypothetical protein Cme02nite_68700 [Catellatospora methionotrophica]|uniref:Uncharacterized protein n=1 Tax=Catellatospora methionotrophica TaxID=121620 RepID=A0A8J3LHR1_9ACTN|nr:hypothetical protein Cme02nite_68700 [Catellatospora methionotrophica]